MERIRERLGRRYEEVREIALNKVISFTIERNPLILSGIIEGTFHYSVYIDETGDYCCSCTGQRVHKILCKHIYALILHSYLEGKISKHEMKLLMEVGKGG